MEKKKISPRLEPLIEELFKGENIANILKKEQSEIIEQCIKKIVSIRTCSILVKEQMAFLKEIKSKKTQKELEFLRENLKDSQYAQQIKEVTNLRIFIIQLVDFFLKMNEKQKHSKDLRSVLAGLFSRASQNLNEQKTIQQINYICFGITGWLKGYEFSNFISQMQGLIKQNEQLKLKNKELEQIKRSLQIIQPNDSQSQDPNDSGTIFEEFVQLPFQDKASNESREAQKLEKETQRYTNQICNLTELSIKIQPALKIDQQSQTNQLRYLETQIQTQKNIFVDFEVQTESKKLITFEIQSQTNQSVSITQEIQTQQQSQEAQQKEIARVQQLRLKQLFYGEFFYGQDDYKERLIKILQQMNKVRIRRTRLLYHYDPLNPINFHQYIDKVKGLLFVLKTISGMFLSGFYSGQLEPDKILNQFGLLISLTNNQSFVLKDEPGKVKSMIYDPYYVIFGNAELRIKFGESTVFSNFGIINSYFNSRGKKLGDFLGEENNNREVKFENYEFHQVLFETFQ